MRHEDVTIVMQGPLTNYWGAMAEGLNCIDTYKKYVDNIVISTWSYSLERFKKNVLDRIIEAQSLSLIGDDIKKYEDFYNNSNVCYQIVTSLNGMKKVKTKYAIKMRCDEYHTDLSKIIELIKSDPEKLTTHNFLFNPDCIEQFHPSDHIAGGLTKNLLNMYQTAYDICDKFSGTTPITADQIGISNYKNVYNDGALSPEALLCLSFLIGKGVEVDCNKSKQIMRDHVQVLPLFETGDFLCNIKGIGHKDYDLFIKSIHGEKSIKSMEEL